MKPKKRQKMCYNCEGEVDLDVIVCPFCAADLRAEKPEQQKPTYNPSAAIKNLNTQQSLYPSQYAPKAMEEEEQSTAPEPQTAFAPEEPVETKYIFGPTILLTLGAQLFLLGMMMWIFQHKGYLTLKWDARMWYLYVIVSAPLLLFGYRSLNKL